MGIPSNALTTRILAELQAEGFQVEESSGENSSESLQKRADEISALAIVKITQTEDFVELDILDDSHTTAFRRRVPIDKDAGVTAVHVVEVVRGHLMSLLVLLTTHRSWSVNTAPQKEPEPTPLPAAPKLSTYSGFSMGIGAQMGSFDASVGAIINAGFRLRMRGPFFWDVWAIVPIVPSRFSSPIGTGNVSMGLGGTGISWQGIGDDHWRIDLGLGFSVGFVGFAGSDATSGYLAQSSSKVVYVPCGRAGLSVRIAPDWSIRADLMAGLAAPQTHVASSSATLGTWGFPWMMGSGGLEYTW
jgi:hypothetical protein